MPFHDINDNQPYERFNNNCKYVKSVCGLFKSQFIRDNAPNKIFKLYNGLLSQFKHSWFCYVIKSYSIIHYIDVFLLSHTSEK